MATTEQNSRERHIKGCTCSATQRLSPQPAQHPSPGLRLLLLHMNHELSTCTARAAPPGEQDRKHEKSPGWAAGAAGEGDCLVWPERKGRKGVGASVKGEVVPWAPRSLAQPAWRRPEKQPGTNSEASIAVC